jgi:nitrate reductase beta subunit
MPVKECQDNNKPGYKWGDSGKCYTYDPKNETSKKEARKKANIQGIAIGDIKLEGLRVSFDFHDTLTTEKGKELLDKEMKERNIIYIISAANSSKDLNEFGKKYGIPLTRIFATGSNQKKVDKIKELNIVRHYDNAQQVKDIIDKEDVKVELIKV